MVNASEEGNQPTNARHEEPDNGCSSGYAFCRCAISDFLGSLQVRKPMFQYKPINAPLFVKVSDLSFDLCEVIFDVSAEAIDLFGERLKLIIRHC